MNTLKKKEKTHFTQSELLAGEWTKGSIIKFLGEPDLEKANPKYACATPMKLYCINRVNKIKNSDKWKTWFNKTIVRRNKQSQRQTLVMDNKRQELNNYIDSLNINIPKLEYDDLIKKSLSHYNGMPVNDEHIKDANTNNDNAFLERITVNYLRHTCDGYEQKLKGLFGRVGNDGAYEKIKCKFLTKIGNIYPTLKSECRRQIDKTNSDYCLRKYMENQNNQ